MESGRTQTDYPVSPEAAGKSRWRQKYEAKMNGKVEQEGKKADEADDPDVIIPE